MTVAELIKILETFDPELPVEMGMNMEYQCKVQPHMLVVETDGDRKYLCIDDCALHYPG